MRQPESAHTNRLWKNVSAEAGARVCYLATRFFIPPFVLGRVGMEAYGLYGTVFMLVAYFGISAIGFSNAYIKHVAEFAASGKTDKANQLLSTGMTLMSALGLAGFGVFTLAWQPLSRWMKVPPALAGDGRTLAFLIVGIFFAYLALSVYRDALTGLQQIGVVQKVWTLSFVLETALIFGLVGFGLGLPGLGWAFFARTVFDIAAHWYVARKRIPWLRVRLDWPDREALGTLLRFGGVVQVNSLLSIFLNSVERVVAAPLLGLSACGLLDIGKRFPSMATSIPSAFASSVLPSAADLHARSGDSSGLSRLYLATSRYMSLVSGSLFAFLCFFSAPALRFWLSDVPPEAILVMILFSAGSQIHMLTGPGTSIVKAAGQPEFEFHYSLGNLAALAALLPACRLAGGAWSVRTIATAVTLSTVVSAAWFLWRMNRRIRVSFPQFAKEVLAPGLLPYGAAAAAWMMLHRLPFHSRLEASAVLLASGTLYLVLLAGATLALAANEEEKAALQQWAAPLLERVLPWRREWARQSR